jgi:hypothetical protein
MTQVSSRPAPIRRTSSAPGESSGGQLALDLDFAGQRTNYANHSIHSYSAKFPPQLAAWAIEQFTSQGETVLDPMLGSGTTLVEARRLGRNGLGTDIDPLARLISRAKSNPPAPHHLQAASRRLLAAVEADFADRMEVAPPLGARVSQPGLLVLPPDSD